MTVNTLIVLRV